MFGLFSGIEKRFGRLDILVNNAGIIYESPHPDKIQEMEVYLNLDYQSKSA
jgi:NAD(P)-dependent dehydrogenase (short-subunit alcohol dehydrogenase family)